MISLGKREDGGFPFVLTTVSGKDGKNCLEVMLGQSRAFKSGRENTLLDKG